MLNPGPMTEDDDRRAARLVIRWRERAAAGGDGAEDMEEIAGDQPALSSRPLDPDRDISRARDRLGEDLGLADERLILAARFRRTTGRSAA